MAMTTTVCRGGRGEEEDRRGKRRSSEQEYQWIQAELALRASSRHMLTHQGLTKCLGASLSVPTQFSGTVLVTSHHSQEVSFDWSSSIDSPSAEQHS